LSFARKDTKRIGALNTTLSPQDPLRISSSEGVYGARKISRRSQGMKEFAHIAKKKMSGKVKTATYNNEWICPDCGASEGDYYETIITCDCKREKYIGNLDEVIEKLEKQGKLLHENSSH